MSRAAVHTLIVATLIGAASVTQAASGTPRTHIVLSPHLDDAVFSMGGGIAAARARGERVIVATFATRSPRRGTAYSPVAQIFHADWGGTTPQAAYTTRRAQDGMALARVGAEPLHVGGLDAIYREDAGGALYGTWERLGGRPLAADPMRPLVRRTIADLRARHPGATFYAPLGVGDHIDHLLVHEEATRSLGKAGPGRLRFYEDLPYAAKAGDAVSRRVAAIGLTLAPEVVALSRVAMARKLAGAGVYDNQLESLFGGRLGMRQLVVGHARTVGDGGLAERLWVPSW